MNYYPEHQEAGVTHTGPGAGWEKPVDRFRAAGIIKNRDTKFARVHAIPHDTYIHIHADKALVEGKHTAFQRTRS
jgi:hypothetical protein